MNILLPSAFLCMEISLLFSFLMTKALLRTTEGGHVDKFRKRAGGGEAGPGMVYNLKVTLVYSGVSAYHGSTTSLGKYVCIYVQVHICK